MFVILVSELQICCLACRTRTKSSHLKTGCTNSQLKWSSFVQFNLALCLCSLIPKSQKYKNRIVYICLLDARPSEVNFWIKKALLCLKVTMSDSNFLFLFTSCGVILFLVFDFVNEQQLILLHQVFASWKTFVTFQFKVFFTMICSSLSRSIALWMNDSFFFHVVVTTFVSMHRLSPSLIISIHGLWNGIVLRIKLSSRPLPAE